MSLNRRLYQWMLNRVGDSAVSGLSVAGMDEQLDTTFFRYVLVAFCQFCFTHLLLVFI